MQRVALLMGDRDGKVLVPRKLSGRGTEGWRDQLSISLDGTGALGGLLPEGGCFIYRPDGSAGGVGYDRWLGRVPALVGTLRAGQRLVGLFYADNAAGDYTPSEQQLRAFDHFIQNAQLCLTLMATR